MKNDLIDSLKKVAEAAKKFSKEACYELGAVIVSVQFTYPTGTGLREDVFLRRLASRIDGDNGGVFPISEAVAKLFDLSLSMNVIEIWNDCWSICMRLEESRDGATNITPEFVEALNGYIEE